MLLPTFASAVSFLVAANLLHTSLQECTPDDEFEDLVNLTLEFDHFMDDLNNKSTAEYKISCENDTSQSVTLNDSFIIDLRFKLYSDRQEEFDKCYKEQDNDKECDQPKFRNCMKTPRKSMYNQLDSWWQDEIDNELDRLAKLC